MVSLPSSPSPERRGDRYRVVNENQVWRSFLSGLPLPLAYLLNDTQPYPLLPKPILNPLIAFFGKRAPFLIPALLESDLNQRLASEPCILICCARQGTKGFSDEQFSLLIRLRPGAQLRPEEQMITLLMIGLSESKARKWEAEVSGHNL